MYRFLRPHPSRDKWTCYDRYDSQHQSGKNRQKEGLLGKSADLDPISFSFRLCNQY